jgi:hypothetical protein
MELTALLDSLSLMQTVQNLMDNEREYDPIRHDHGSILRAILRQLNLRTAPTTLFKVKAHCGSLLNEIADRLADAGTNEPPQGPDPDPPPSNLHYTAITTSHHHVDDPPTTPTRRSTKDQHSQWLRNLQAWRTATCHKQDKTRAFITRTNLSRDLFNVAIRSTAHGLTDSGAKQVMQALCGTFPTRHKLWLQGRFHTPFCPFCPSVVENMTHWQCLCPQFHDSRTAAHNNIWNVLGAQLQKHSPHHIQLEQAMLDTSLQVDGRYRNWRPDGIAQTTNAVFLLEFTRCSDNRNSPLPLAIERKEIKYLPLLENIRSRNKFLNVTLITFAVGYLGSLDQLQFQANLTALGIPPKHHDSIRLATISATLSAFAKMAAERSTAHHTTAPKQPVRPWEGLHRPLKPRPFIQRY